MYEQVEKPKENKSRAVANTVAQKKSNEKQGFVFVDNRPEAVAQSNQKRMLKSIETAKNPSQLHKVKGESFAKIETSIQRVINITEDERQIEASEAISLAIRKYPNVIGKSLEIYISIREILTSYDDLGKSFSTLEEMWEQLEIDLNRESEKQHENEEVLTEEEIELFYRDVLKGNKIAIAMYEGGGGEELSREFAENYVNGSNPSIPEVLMVKLQQVGWLFLEALKYRESLGGQNGMVYYFSVKGSRSCIGEWHVHWESGKKAGNPGWKKGKNGPKTPTGDAMRRLIGNRWAVVKSTGGRPVQVE